MTIRRELETTAGIFFITFTCYSWLPLFTITDGYGLVYKQFDVLRSEQHAIVGYVTMPNHVHVLVSFTGQVNSINSRIGTLKRFLAYDLVKLLKLRKEIVVLQYLADGVNTYDRKKGKLHEVFEPSFDIKQCYTTRFLKQKLEYIHANPCRGKWRLCVSPEEYVHSSANYYLTGQPGIYRVRHYLDL
ncbi:hypothetical protein [Taibaiella chishuiensis]|uniref:Transposase IS200-like domain-containing protein n=1 Tax=Taibaiella chishuiensis TaxID=1434707 RepID=A0A2P8DDE5_9BACT|nr:hypothetical protein [Taibaiella chishuiensis]PSK95219.1 hypothetical protein B0I18_1011385 [Taibaiella chishuiensis]